MRHGTIASRYAQAKLKRRLRDDTAWKAAMERHHLYSGLTWNDVTIEMFARNTEENNELD